MASQLSLYNSSLRIVKHRKLSTLTDDTEARYLLDDEYAKVVAWMLEQGLWNFALRTLALEASVDVEPEFGFSYAFEKPDDYVRLNAISGNATFYPTLDEFNDEGSYWVANCDPLYLSYISNHTDYGNDLGRWPSSFELAVEHELAYRIAPHLTAMGDNEYRDLERRRDRAVRDARSKDAMNQPVSRPPPGRLVQARGYGSGHGGRPWWR